MQLRNFFRRNDNLTNLDANNEGFSVVKVSGGNGVRDITNEGAEYQLIDIDDQGHFLLPLPTIGKPGFWRAYSSSASDTSSSTTQRSSASIDNEPFNMSRESFDSYRRSFDISTRSPIMDHFTSYTHPHSYFNNEIDVRTAESDLEHRLRTHWPDEHISTNEGAFEDVALHESEEDAAARIARQRQQQHAQHEDSANRGAEKDTSPRRGLFSLRFGDGAESGGFSLFSSSKGKKADDEGELSDFSSRPSTSSSVDSDWL